MASLKDIKRKVLPFKDEADYPRHEYGCRVKIQISASKDGEFPSLCR